MKTSLFELWVMEITVVHRCQEVLSEPWMREQTDYYRPPLSAKVFCKIFLVQTIRVSHQFVSSNSLESG